ncbi:MAG: hypothetical protein EOR04_11045 [Mesorhizobium sp.]|uniref:glycosyltransferase n=1 Tax=Mesorhizobium sp. TaxID=1871066 RepID=UPI000FE8B02E|nr:glycosyltransferase [Mesorhizobium sp.]RWP42699.1 MAG: hypothetical protein EOR04_11045 [Mesorhizobium sp.]
MSRRVLLLTQRFAPDTVVAAVRASAWARGLAARGWDVHCITRNYGGESALETNVTVHRVGNYAGSHSRTNSDDAGRSLAIGRWIWPDPSGVFWLRNVGAIKKLSKSIAPDIVLSSSPPHSIHLLGHHLAATNKVPWVADFRDPYLEDVRYGGANAFLYPAHWVTERWMYKRADRIIHAIPTHDRQMRLRAPNLSHRMHLITNAALFDPYKFRQIRRTGHERELVAFSGGTVDPDIIEALVRGAESIRMRLRIEVAGWRYSAPNSSPGVSVEYLGPLPHHLYHPKMACADVLVGGNSPDRQKVGGLSSKLFDYLSTGRPIIFVRPTKADVEYFGHIERVLFTGECSTGVMATWLSEAAHGSKGSDLEAGQFFFDNHNLEKKVSLLDDVLEEAIASYAEQ